MTIDPPVERSSNSADLGRVGSLDPRQLRRDALGQDAHRAAVVRGLEPLAQVLSWRARNRSRSARGGRQQVRDEGDREAERLRDLGRVSMRADRGTETRSRARSPHASSASAPARRPRRPTLRPRRRLRIDRVTERPEREQHRGRVAAGVGDQPPVGRRELGQPVAPAAPSPPRMLEAVPLRVRLRVGEPVRPGEIDHDRVARRLERRGLLVVEAEEEELGSGGERRLVRDEARAGAVRRSASRRGSSAVAPRPRASPSRRRTARARGGRARDRGSPVRRSPTHR